jgi:hypothetical protein
MQTDAAETSSGQLSARRVQLQPMKSRTDVRAEVVGVQRTVSRRSGARHWYSGFVVLPLTVLRTFSMLRSCDLGAFVPFVAVLFMTAGVLWIVNAIAPLAPLIYSLF